MIIPGIPPLRNGSSTEFPHDLLKEVAASKRQFSHSKLQLAATTAGPSQWGFLSSGL